MRIVVLIAVAVSLTMVQTAAAQETQAPPPAEPAEQDATPDDDQSVKEVGGRLIVDGGTVLVAPDPDLPPQDSSIATKTDTRLIETPRSVSVTDRRTLDDRLAVNISDAHDYTVGVTPMDDRGPAFARGFRIDFYDLRRDGLRTYTWSVREPVGLERVQYLRGPASVLYGDGSPGGLVNLMLKKPLPVRRTEVTASIGELGFGRFTADQTGPVGGNRRVRYRLIGAGEWLDSGIHNDERRLSFLPMLSVDVGDAVTLHVDGELYQQQGRNYWHMVPVTPETQHGDFTHIPWGLTTASPDDDWSGWNASSGLRLDARLNRRTSLHVSGRYTRIDGDIDIQVLSGLAQDTHTLNRYAYREISTWSEYQSDAFIATALATGSVEHQLVMGVEGGLSTTDRELGIGSAPSVDLFSPVYDPKPSPIATQPTKYDVFRAGAYVQDQIRVGSAIVITPALRGSWLSVESRVLPNVAPNDPSRERASTDTVVSPSIGAVVLPRPWLSLYATVARGFEPPPPGQYLEDGRALAASENTLVEAGVKSDLADGRLAVSTGVYGIRRTNVPEVVALGVSRQIGEGKSRGVELEVAGRIVGGFGLTAGYAWNHTQVTRDAGGFIGRELPNAPNHKVNVWTHYRFTEGTFKGLMLAAGVVYVSDRFINRDNIFIAPAYTRVDASGSYVLTPALKLSVLLQNATNIRYVTSGSGSALYAGEPRRAAVQISVSH